MSADCDLTVAATTSGLRHAMVTLDTFCAANDLGEGVASRARVVLEELFTNTIKYGYGGECERPVRLRLSTATGLTVTFEDEAGPFDPTAWRPPVALAQLGSERPVGQAGIALVMGLSSSVAYKRLSGGNQVTIVFSS